MKKILASVLIIAASVACNHDSKQDWDGMEYFDFEISGKVTDSVGTSINGISVSAAGSEVRTKVDGTYFLEGTGGKETAVFISFSDRDGMENGGMFMGTSRSVQLEYVKGAHGPYLGLFRKSSVDVSLNSGLTPVPDFSQPL